MFFGIIKSLFILSAITFALLIIFHKKITIKIKDNIKKANYVAAMAFSLFVYITCAFIGMILISGIEYKLLMLIFAICPFIIGKIATYKKIKLYSFVQLVIMIISTIVISLK